MLYRIRDDIKKDTLPIEIMEDGPYKGVLFRILHIGFDENPDKSATCHFSYEILDDIGLGEELLRKDGKFEGVLAKILESMINIAVEQSSKIVIKEKEKRPSSERKTRKSRIKKSNT